MVERRDLKRLFLLSVLVLVEVPLHGSSAAEPADAGRVIHQELQRLDRHFAAERRAPLTASEEGSDDDEKRALGEHFVALEAEIRRLPEETAAALLHKLQQVRHAAFFPAAPAPAAALAHPRAKHGGPPENDACLAALPLSLGTTVTGTTTRATVDGTSACGNSAATPDVWYRVTASDFGRLVADTNGSDFDTVLSLHPGCPGTFNDFACNDDATGLAAAVGFDVSPGQSVLVRVSGFDGATGDFQLRLGMGGSVSGEVRSSIDSAPIADAFVAAFDARGESVRSTSTDAAGAYRLDSLDSGSYFIHVANAGRFMGEVYSDLLCPSTSISLACDVTRGTPVAVPLDGETSGIDFRLSPGGRIEGTLRNAATGEPIAGSARLAMTLRSPDRDVVLSDAQGHYVLDAIPPGRYLVLGEGSGFRTELYEDVPCPGGFPFGCAREAGTPITITATEGVSGIDFALDRLGQVSGRVVDAANGVPIPFLDMGLFALHDPLVTPAARTDTSGNYVFGGVLPGTYGVRTRSSLGGSLYVDEVYDNVPCLLDFGDCDVTQATPILVSFDSVVTEIDFALDQAGGITGTVARPTDGEPLPGIEVRLHRNDGSLRTETSSDSTGAYTFFPIVPGNYFVTASDSSDTVLGELYQELPCEPSCDPTSGTPVPVALATITSDIDFTLDAGGTLSGTVRAAVGGAPLEDIFVSARGGPSGEFRGFARTDASGRYAIAGLASGTYHLTASSSVDEYQRELYREIPCPNDCDLSSGTPVSLVAGATVEGLDFTLDRLGEISGRVTRARDGSLIPFVRLRVSALDGSLQRSTLSQEDGRYRVFGLPPGSYVVQTFGAIDNSENVWIDQRYRAVPCFPDGSCAASGTPIPIALNVSVGDVDFALEEGGRISGRVHLMSILEDLPPIAQVQLWRSDGQLLDSIASDRGGYYAFTRLQTGSYFVTAESFGHVSEVWNDIPCPPEGCSPLAGTPIPVRVGEETADIDFALARTAAGVLRGTVTDALNGAPLPFAVELRRLDGSLAEAFSIDFGSDGRYVFFNVPAGRYFLAAGGDHLGDEVYDDVPCSGELGENGCPFASGTPVEIRTGETTLADFALSLQAGLRGRVVRAEDGRPLAAVRIDLWNELGQRVTTVTTGPGGAWSAPLPPGTYFVSTDNQGNGTDEVYDNLPCPVGPLGISVCDPLLGIPIELAADAIVSGIDFALVGAIPRCIPSATRLCLLDGRFQVDVSWRSFSQEGRGRARPVNEAFGTFWFFDPTNLELAVKILDACALPSNRFWVFAAGLTNVATAITVTDLATGDERRYTTALGESFQPLQDTDAFATCDAVPRREARAAPSVAAPFALPGSTTGACIVDDQHLCLADGRFRVEALWSIGAETELAQTAVHLTGDTGYFAFFGPNNVEVVVKVLNACDLEPFHNIWVFAAGLTNVKVRLRVEDTATGEVREYLNPLHTPYTPIQDTEAFDVCF